MKIIFMDFPGRKVGKFSSKVFMAMKLTFILILLACLQVSAHVDAQEITLSKKSVSLEKVFKEIRKQTGYEFLYNSAMLESKNKAPVDFNHTPLKEALNTLLQKYGLTYTLLDKTIVVKEKAKQEQLAPIQELQLEDLTGTVVDSTTGEPLVGVTIKVRGSTMGTTTDVDGSFSLEVPDDAVLEVSYLGYGTKVVSVSGKTQLTIALASTATGLNQLVVVGYGTQKKENLTGAVDQIEGEDIAMRPSATINTALQGLMPGLNIQVNNGDPTANPDINIRGFTSINGGSPLVLIDGIEGDLEDINPNDVKTVTVLKDAASAAIYGARGAFGVILVTTKSGKAGKIKVNYSNNFGWTTPTTRTDFISDPYVYAKTVDNAIFGYNGTSYTPGFTDVDWAALKMVADGEIAPFKEKQTSGKYKFFYKTNWHDYLFRKYQPSQFHNISLSGGTEQLHAYLSGRVHERATINNIDHNNVDRYNLNAKITFEPVKWMQVSANVKYMDEQNMDYGGYRNGYGGIWSTTTWYDLFPFYPNFIDGIPTDVGRSGSGGQGGAAAMEAGDNWRKYDNSKLTNTLSAKLTPLKGLELNVSYSNRLTHRSRTYRYAPFEYLTTDELKEQTVGVNRTNEYRWKINYKALNVFGTYQLHIHNDHNFKLMLGYNQESYDRDRIVVQGNDLLLRDQTNLAFVTEMYNMNGSTLDWAVQGYFGRFNYDYKGKYLLEVDARYDGSSRFPKNSRWGFFPSVSAGWQLNRENFWRPIKKYVSTFKIRASYGQLGNQTVPVNTFMELMDAGQIDWLVNGDKLISAKAPSPLPSNVTWETTKTIDFGVDFGVLDNHLLASFDWYRRATDNMYLPGKPLPGVFGASEPKENFASLENKGFELALTYRNTFEVAGKPLKFSMRGSLSNYKAHITKYDNPEGLMSTYWEGQRLGEIWGYHIDGQFQSDQEAADYQASFNNPSVDLAKVYRFEIDIAQNSDWNKLRAGDIKYVDLNGDGKIDNGDYTLEDHGDLQPIGNAMPQFIFGFNMNASYRGFDISVAGAGVGKQDWYPTGDIFWGTYQRPYLSFLRKDLVKEAWTPEYHGKYPQIYRGYVSLNGNRSLYEMNDYYLTNVGFLRVKNLTVGYTLPKKLTQKAFIQKARIYFSGENIFTIRFGDLTRYVDPEQAGSAINYSKPGDATARADLRAYPMGKTYSFGIQLTL